jgi:hypothetical protein
MSIVNIGRFVPGLAALPAAADLQGCGAGTLVWSNAAKIAVASRQ